MWEGLFIRPIRSGEGSGRIVLVSASFKLERTSRRAATRKIVRASLCHSLAHFARGLGYARLVSSLRFLGGSSGPSDPRPQSGQS